MSPYFRVTRRLACQRPDQAVAVVEGLTRDAANALAAELRAAQMAAIEDGTPYDPSQWMVYSVLPMPLESQAVILGAGEALRTLREAA